MVGSQALTNGQIQTNKPKQHQAKFAQNSVFNIYNAKMKININNKSTDNPQGKIKKPQLVAKLPIENMGNLVVNRNSMNANQSMKEGTTSNQSQKRSKGIKI